ncbi:hypothetical protein ACC719_35150, partial [Rhizobium ruizarguesonis]
VDSFETHIAGIDSVALDKLHALSITVACRIFLAKPASGKFSAEIRTDRSIQFTGEACANTTIDQIGCAFGK